MADAPDLIYNDRPGALPATYRFPPGLDARLSSVSAVFDGTGAGADFLACLSVYSQDDKLIGRFFPGSPVVAGDVAEVTFAPFLAADAEASTWPPVAGSLQLFRAGGGGSVSIPDGVPTLVDWLVNVNTMGATSPDNISWTMPAATDEVIFAVWVSLKLSAPAAGFTTPFQVSVRGAGGYNGSGCDVAMVGPGPDGFETVALPGSQFSSDTFSVEITQSSGKTLTLNRGFVVVCAVGLS